MSVMTRREPAADRESQPQLTHAYLCLMMRENRRFLDENAEIRGDTQSVKTIHVLVDGQEIAQLGPVYVDLVAPWKGRTVAQETWAQRIVRDSGLEPRPNYRPLAELVLASLGKSLDVVDLAMEIITDTADYHATYADAMRAPRNRIRGGSTRTDDQTAFIAGLAGIPLPGEPDADGKPCTRSGSDATFILQRLITDAREALR